MSMEALINADVLAANLQRKHDEIPDRLNRLVHDVSNIYRNMVVIEAPRITGNLKSSIRVEDIDNLSRRVFPDENQAPYAEYVLCGIRGKGKVPENDFMGRGAEKGKVMSDGKVNEFLSWLKS